MYAGTDLPLTAQYVYLDQDHTRKRRLYRSLRTFGPRFSRSFSNPTLRTMTDDGLPRTALWLGMSELSFRSKSVGLLFGLIGPVLVVAGWWYLATSGSEVRSSYLPSPISVLGVFADGPSLQLLATETLKTLGHFAVGFLAAALVGIMSGVALGRLEVISTAVRPILNFMRSLPGIAVLPIFALILGLSDVTISGVSAFSAVWFILLNTAAGIETMDPVTLDTGRVFEVTGWRRLWYLMLPSAAPRIMTGLRLGLGIALVVSVSSEIIIGRSGLGFVIADSMATLQPARAYAGIISVGLLAWVVLFIGEKLETRLVPWSVER
ncbi:MAG: ABC transporter permease subunit [Acidimicrobiia bacterium]|nr:ABC transporter permease subunit [Acidimicrobiia bacterium]